MGIPLLGAAPSSAVFESSVEEVLGVFDSPCGTPLQFCVASMLGVSFLCWFVSVVTHNYSQVDRLWSILPVYYAIVFCAFDGLLNSRLAIWAFCISVWGARLSYNFYRKGGYNMKEEDYRWPELRKRINPFAYQIFNIVFIAFYQNVLLLLLALPLQVCYLARESSSSLFLLDWISFGLFIAFLVGESVADQQQWRFQSKKYELKRQNKKLTGDFAKGFLTQGLFKYSRHPNFFCEISIWWTVYLSSVAASGVWFNWTIAGAFLLTLLFQGSTNFTEELTSGRYPEYRTYQKTTSRLIPLPKF